MWILIGYGVLLIGALLAVHIWKSKGGDPRKVKYFWIAALTGAVCLICCLGETFGETEGQALQAVERQEPGGGARTIPLKLTGEELLEEYEYTVSVKERILTEAQLQDILLAAQGELEQGILGDNPSPQEITRDLRVPKTLQKGLVEVTCFFSPGKLVDTNGSICWDATEGEPELVWVQAQLSCQGTELEHTFFLELQPPEEGSQAGILLAVSKLLEKENLQTGEELQLPQQVNGVSLKWYGQEDVLHTKLLLLGLILLCIGYVSDKEKTEREKKRRELGLQLDYPDLISQLSLLSGAGMTMKAAWAKVASEYQQNHQEGKIPLRPGFEEMVKTWHEIQDGTGELQAYGNFGTRCGQGSYRKFASILMQNIRKGTKGLQQLLDAEAGEALVQRKLQARRLGEEAGTKLLIPMGIMLVLVFAILMIPAMLTLQV